MTVPNFMCNPYDTHGQNKMTAYICAKKWIFEYTSGICASYILT